MKRICSLFIVLATCGIHSYSQSISPRVVASNGTFASAGGYTLSYTTGQPASTTLTTSSSIITQGFQQPNDIYTGLQTFVTPALTVQLYPNPATTLVNVTIGTFSTTDIYIVQLVDLLGRVLEQPLATQIINGQIHFVFNVRQLPSSMYFITIKSSGSSVIHSFKFNKIN